MFFAVVYSELGHDEVIAFATGDTVETVIDNLAYQDIDFDQYHEAGNVVFIEGDMCKLRKVSTYTIAE